MVNFKDTKAPINIANIQKYEQLLQFEFPLLYKEHLLKYNGGKCTPNVFIFSCNGRMDASDIRYFFALNGDRNDDFAERLNTYKLEQKRLPKKIIPFAVDDFGNLICISCYQEDFGHIYFWDHEEEVDYYTYSDDVRDNLYFLAKDLPTFLNGLIDDAAADAYGL